MTLKCSLMEILGYGLMCRLDDLFIAVEIISLFKTAIVLDFARQLQWHRRMLLLYETASGYAIFRISEKFNLTKVDDLWSEFESPDKARQFVQLVNFRKFSDINQSLKSTMDIMENKCSKTLKKVIKKFVLPEIQEKLAVADAKLGNLIQEKFPGISCLSNSKITELFRGVRSNLNALLVDIPRRELENMAVALAHNMSRHKLKFTAEKIDMMIVQAIGLHDDLDRELNNYAMRCREWYGWHFPELGKCISDHLLYAQIVERIGFRECAPMTNLSDLLSEDLQKKVKKMSLHSLGTEISTTDLKSIKLLCKQIIEISKYRTELGNYLRARMFSLAPNLASLTGEIIGARLIARAGSLLGLSKMSASTIQIIGAEKALFRAIKTKRDTPKYGLIYHAQIISTVPQKLKGKVARMLANKATLAVRYDALSEHTDDGDMNILGLEQRAILEKRIKALETEIAHQVTKTKKVRFREAPYIIQGGGELYDTSADFTLPRKRKHENDNASDFIETKKLKLTSILKDEKKERSKKLTIQGHQLAEEAQGYKVDKKMKKEKHLKEESVFMEQPAVESFVEQEEMVESSKKKKKKKKRTSDSADITLESVEALGEIKTEPQLEIVEDVNVKKKKRKRKSGEEIESSEKKITVKEEREKEEKRKDDDDKDEEEDSDLKNLSQELSVKSKKKKKMKKQQIEEEYEAKEEEEEQQHLYGEDEGEESKLNLSTQSTEKKKKKKKKKKNDSEVEQWSFSNKKNDDNEAHMLPKSLRRQHFKDAWPRKEEACAPEILSIRRNRQLFVLCRHRPVLAKSLLSGLKEAVRECQFQMKHNRWNCSFGYHSMDYTLLDNPPILNFGYKETSFLVALSSAGAAWSVARACANGQLTSCTCNNRQHSSQQAWKWGGCSYSIKFGLVNSRRLLTSKHSIHKANLLKLVYKHNLKAGRMALKRTLKRDCKCHGISGSCQMKTCWKSPAEFREIGTHLKKKLSRAMFILQNHSPNDSRYIAQQLKAAELVYFEQSPTYCEPLSHIRSVGTRGRICSVRNQTHSFADCEIVCCGRGYFHQAELVVENCNCKFHWCCQVMCDKCRRTNWISKCR
ncbi:Nucleolar protein 58 [Trichinella murrelli]|uniref:Protein Wnt n=1 Tax=Trichinella murrelli TaxID=144512 RepID=A0A0V0TU70_9BILA|nr:Nucleolar protein 58 [Trichinella murrelli]